LNPGSAVQAVADAEAEAVQRAELAAADAHSVNKHQRDQRPLTQSLNNLGKCVRE
jgi:hypothetical protein